MGSNEREAVAVVKLVSHTAKYFPGVFFHGSDSASLLPILARLLPFFSDPLFRSRHVIFFEALGSLLSLLRACAPDTFRHFFIDAMLAVQERDILRWGKNIVSSKTKTKRRAGAAVYNRASSLETLVSILDVNLA
ncbi:hypothetical protein PIB30_048072 [Stylosanthes scabra]|uniref:Uncharacterized protein n=1 Tax=Stylosanthes scabra TaxID=79078 RepID=A0ABU6UFL8_9FABA|nr:hypothetical protein [Stylosanthes scabra]